MGANSTVKEESSILQVDLTRLDYLDNNSPIKKPTAVNSGR